jgi:hypothetical protein
MRSRSELADTYEAWAAENERYAENIVGSLHDCDAAVRNKQVERAIVLIHEAQAYRRDAANLRSSWTMRPSRWWATPRFRRQLSVTLQMDSPGRSTP